MIARARLRARGFTLIELLVAVVVLVVLLGLGVPAFKETIATQRIKTASFDLFSALNYARSEAVKRNTSISLKAGETSSGAWTTGWRVEDGSGNRLRSWGSTSNVAITETVGGATTVTYGSDGRLTTTTVPKLEISPASAISGVSSRCVSVELSGRPSTQTGSCSS
jgi:type IV fimbrial biogenesis protein FimT